MIGLGGMVSEEDSGVPPILWSSVFWEKTHDVTGRRQMAPMDEFTDILPCPDMESVQQGDVGDYADRPARREAQEMRGRWQQKDVEGPDKNAGGNPASEGWQDIADHLAEAQSNEFPGD